jgi:6-phosphogluconolactonase
MREIIVARDTAEMNRRATEKFAAMAEESIKDRGRFTISLSGGSTPKALYRLLSAEPDRSTIDWEKVLFFFGDERNVPFDSGESNFRMANESLLSPLGISKDKVFRWKTELADPILAAADYEKVLASNLESIPPVFDLILLGMGPDGHTASLFPGTTALDEKDRMAVANPVPQLDTTRLTLTYPVINAARNVAFLVAGEDKANMLSKVLDSDSDADFHDLPSRGVRPENGKLWWFVDAAAAKYVAL